jgi:RND family efflux transporter MFP subunit
MYRHKSQTKNSVVSHAVSLAVLESLPGILICAILTAQLSGCAKQKQSAALPPEVVVAPVQQRDVPIFGEWVAQLNGPINAAITPKVQGYLLSQDYINGAFVTKGQLLFRIDPRPFEAAVDQSKAEVDRTMASLSKASNDVQRDTPLAAQKAIPQKQLDDDIANRAWAAAEVEAKKAALQEAELNLGWTKVFSPVDGVAGIASAQVGDLVGPTTKMTTVSQIDPIWAYFNISETLYLTFAPQISRILQSGSVRISRPVEYIQANDIPYPAKGTVVFVNREIAAGT